MSMADYLKPESGIPGYAPAPLPPSVGMDVLDVILLAFIGGFIAVVALRLAAGIWRSLTSKPK